MYKKFILVFNSLPNSYSFGWLFNSPPKPYANITLSLESKISITSFTRHLSFVNVITSILIFIIFFLFRKFVFVELYYILNITILEDIHLKWIINKDLFLGVWAIISRISLKGFIEDLLEVFLPQKLLIGDEKLPLFMNQDPISEGKDGSKEPIKRSIKAEQKIMDLTFTDLIALEFDKFKGDMAKYAKSLQDRHQKFDKGKVTLDDPGVPGILIYMLQDQTQFYNASILTRIALVKVTEPNLPLDVKNKMLTIVQDIYKLQNEHTNNISKIRNIKEEKQQVKEYFDLLNAYRNKVRKEIILLETISREEYRKNLPDLYKLKEYKKLVNIDAPKAIKEVVDQDGYLKSKISEIVNAKKK